ncbi:MAG: SLBB domain-containing protein [Patescibacteria group bacterium]
MIWGMWQTQAFDLSGIKTPSNQVKGLILLGVLCEGLGGLLLWNRPQLVQSWTTPVQNDQLLETSQVEPTSSNLVWVDVSGAVNKPGVYQLANGSLVAEAVEQAGGLAKTADKSFVTQQLNLAESVKGGSKLYIPSQAEREFQGEVAEWCQVQLKASSVTANQNQKNGGLVSINQASRAELMSLTGIGEKRADDIIQNRPFTSLDELVEKAVISQNLLNEIKGQLSL